MTVILTLNTSQQAGAAVGGRIGPGTIGRLRVQMRPDPVSGH
jgi:hypothetical protein